MFEEKKLEYLDFTYNNFNIYTASDKNKNKYIVKTTKDLYSNRDDILLLENEYNILKKLTNKRLLLPLDIEKYDNRIYLYFEYFDGFSLRHFFNNINSTQLLKFLSISIKIIEVLNYIHKNRIIHNFINCNSILINKDFSEIRLVNFEYSFYLNNSDIKPFINNGIYTAPEQTDRIDLNPNEKTDIYSLGVLFYELIIGQDNYSEMFKDISTYDIVAKELPKLSSIKNDFPELISNIIHKMIVKNPDDRYDSLLSLLIDLKKAFNQLTKSKQIDNFPLDTLKKDFLTGNKNLFFGRDEEITSFLINFSNDKDTNQLYVISGKSGTGKTTFIKKGIEYYKNSFNLIEVKFDNYKQYIPYKTLFNSFRTLCKEILIKDKSELLHWKSKLLVSIGEEIQVLFDFIPELKTIVGEQDSIEVLNLVDSKNRFNNILIKFLQLFATKKNPLIIFLDDMQWSDNITLEWLDSFIQRVSYVKVVLTYRDNEVDKNSLLLKKIKSIKKSAVRVFEYHIKELTKVNIENLITTNIELNNSSLFSTLVYKKTGGNAFFVIQFLKDLLYEKVLYFDEEKLTWNYDVERLNKVNAKSSIIEFLEKRISILSDNEILLLQIASCVGNLFSYKILKNITKLDDDFDNTLKMCLDNEWISKSGLVDNKYFQFSHDRIQQVFYSSINEKTLISFHKLIGDFYYKDFKSRNEENLLLCVNHYNKAKKHFIENSKTKTLGKLNHKASLLARKNGDFELSDSYINKLFEFYNGIETDINYGEYLKDYAVCKHLIYNQTKAIEFYYKALDNCNDDLKKAYIYEQLIKLYSDFSDFESAYKIGKKALSLFDIFIPSGFNPILFVKEFLELKIKLSGKNTEDLLKLKEAEDERVIIAIKLLSCVLKAAYQIKPQLCVLVAMKVVKACIKYGDTKDAVIGFMVFGIIFQGAVLGNHKLGYDYAMLSLNMIKKYKNSILEPEVKFVSGYFGLSWINPTSITEKNWNESYKNGILIGDLFHSACAATGISESMFLRGCKFSELNKQLDVFIKELSKRGGSEQLAIIVGIKQALKNIQGKTYSLDTFSDESFDENKYIKKLDNFSSLHFAHIFYINKIITLYFHEKYELSLKYIEISKQYLNDSKGTVHSTEHYFYESLIYSKLLDTVGFKDKILFINKIKKNTKMFEEYAKLCPENFVVRKYILNAIVAKVKNDYILAQKYFFKALEIAKVYSQLNLKTIASKNLFEIYTYLEQTRFANIYKNEYIKNIREWSGFTNNLKENERIENISLDIYTLIKSSEIIFKEKELSSLLKSLIKILLESSGAQNAIIILEEDFEYKVEAFACNNDLSSIKVLVNKEYKKFEYLLHDIVKYVIRTKEQIVINDLEKEPLFFTEKENRKVKSVLSFPLILQDNLKGVIYLENNLISGVFTEEKIELLKHISTQIAISIENAKIYKNLEEKVQNRTKDLDNKNEVLQKQNRLLQEQNKKILNLNTSIIEENEKRKIVELKLQKAVKELDLLATTDSLTKLKNRRVFDKVLEEECMRVSRNNDTLSLIMCDIDYFKRYNDFYGHVQGDECLKFVSEILESNIKRTTDVIARYGGEEFSIIMPNTKKEEAITLANNIIKSFAKEQKLHEKSDIANHITISMGVASSNEIEILTPKNLIRAADNKLYEAKENGRNQVKY